jgi:hypothetical protein
MGKVGKTILIIFVMITALYHINTATVHAESKPPLLTYTIDTSLGTDKPLYTPNVNEIFNVTIMVVNITDLYGWQVKLYYDASIIKCVKAFYPPDHVFAGKLIVPVEAVIDNEGNGSVLYGCTLLGAAETFSGTGKLCTFTFNGTELGITTLHFSQPYGEDTFLWDSNAKLIPAEVIDATVNVIPEFTAPTILAVAASTVSMATITLKKKLKKN